MSKTDLERNEALKPMVLPLIGALRAMTQADGAVSTNQVDTCGTMR